VLPRFSRSQLPVLNLDLESRILRALCSNPSSRTDNSAARAIILARLRPHLWQDSEHRVVFEALTALPGRDATELREQLPAQATRMGFPDVNWENYFASVAADSAIESLVAELLATSRKLNP
jgi:hypothetical protein